MSHYEDESQSRRGRSQRDRDYSPDYQYAGGTAPPYPSSAAGGPYASGASNIRIPSPGRPAHPGAASQPRLAYDPDVPFYPPPPVVNTLQVPDARHRPRSMPPPDHGRRSRHSRYEGDDEEEDDRARDQDRDRGHGDRSPVAKAKNLLGNTFTDSTTGLGVGVLGALVGGLAAREASEAASRHSQHGRPPTEAQKRAQLLTTVVGAAVGALGANAVEKRIELNREKSQRQQDRWEERWRPGSRGNGNAEIIDRREIITRPRRGSAGHDGWREWEDRDRGVTREVDPDARSWRNVEDWVYDDRDRDRNRDRDRDHGRGRRSDDHQQYRW